MLYVEEYLNYLKFEKRFSNHTFISYQNDITQCCEFLEKEFSISSPVDITHKMVRHWMVHLLDNNLVPRSVNRKLSALKSFFRFLLKQEVISINPMNKISPPKAGKRLPVFVGEEQMNTLLDKIDLGENFEGLRNKLIVEMFYFTGIRLSELINLKNADIDFSGLAIKVLGKRNKERIIPITADFAKRIESYQKLLSESLGPPTYLYVGKSGKKLYPMAIQRIIKEAIQQVSSIEKKSPHVIRHTFATHMLNHGADLNSIKELLGHANLAATQVYTHNTFEKLKRVYKQSHPRA